MAIQTVSKIFLFNWRRHLEALMPIVVMPVRQRKNLGVKFPYLYLISVTHGIKVGFGGRKNTPVCCLLKSPFRLCKGCKQYACTNREDMTSLSDYTTGKTVLVTSFSSYSDTGLWIQSHSHTEELHNQCMQSKKNIWYNFNLHLSLSSESNVSSLNIVWFIL